MAYGFRKLLTIITEAEIHDILIKDLKSLNVRGYTIWNAHGEGDRGMRSGEWDSNKNVCIQVICSEKTAHTLSQFLFDHYYENYAMVIYIADVEVLRPEKF